MNRYDEQNWREWFEETAALNGDPVYVGHMTIIATLKNLAHQFPNQIDRFLNIHK